MKHLPPFDLIRRSVEISTIRGELRVNVSYEDFIRLLKKMISGTEVDEDWYFEGRLPFPMKVDERWYMTQYPDVADSVRRGVLPSAQAHFDEDGYREGRMPYGM